jgi:FG-GAP repeat/FG-GAP-like repeat
MWRALALSVLLALALAAPAAAARTIDVRERASLVLVGEKRSDVAGASVAAAGDVNGDGHADVIVGAPLADPLGRQDAGSAYVIFGPAPRGRLELGALGRRGFRIDAPAPPSWPIANFRVAAAGDVNGDGRADVLVSTRGGSFVVFGKRDEAPVDLAAIGSVGFALPAMSLRGRWPAGDMNGDGVPDFALAFDIDFDEELGALSIMYGTPGGVVDGFTAVGAIGGVDLGFAAAPAGDVNGDGFDDLLASASGIDAVVILYGRRQATDLRIDPAKPFPGRIIRAPRPGRWFGFALARYGRGFVAGAPGPTLRPGHRGAAWIVPATGEPVRLDGPRSGGPAGIAVDVPGDVLGGPAREVLVIARGRFHGRAKSLLFDRRGLRLRTYVGAVNAGWRRAPAAGIGDVGGGPRPDLLFGSPGESRAYLVTRP